ncbi:MAG: kelch repeat-containing protein [Myxococcota bacterium]
MSPRIRAHPIVRAAFAVLVACGGSAGAPDGAPPLDGALDGAAFDGAPLDAAVNMDAASDRGVEDLGLSDAPDGGEAAAWMAAEPLPGPRQEIATAIFEGHVVVVGGFVDAATPVAQVLAFDGERWSRLPDLPEPRHHPAVVATEGALYVLGGMRDRAFTLTATAFVLRAGADTWEPIASLPEPRAAGNAVAVLGDSMLVIAGGPGPGRTLDERLGSVAPVYRYLIDEDRWELGASVETPREHTAAVADGNGLILFGGRRLGLEPTFDAVARYDPERDAWQTLPAMPSPRGGFAATRLGDIVYVSGGEERAAALNSVDRYDVRTRTWSAAPPMLSPRHGHVMATFEGRVYAIGGGSDPVFSPIAAVEVLVP